MISGKTTMASVFLDQIFTVGQGLLNWNIRGLSSDITVSLTVILILLYSNLFPEQVIGNLCLLLKILNVFLQLTDWLAISSQCKDGIVSAGDAKLLAMKISLTGPKIFYFYRARQMRCGSNFAMISHHQEQACSYRCWRGETPES
jgi:hypothetical protein